MIYIVYLVACLADQPGQCAERVIDLPEVTNVSSCQLVGHFRVKEWLEAHPDMRVSEAKCMGKPIKSAENQTAGN